MDEAILADACLMHYTFKILTDKIDIAARAACNQNYQDSQNYKSIHKDLALIVPATFNGAFGCELYMKAILSDTLPNTPHEHKLNKLFELMNPNVQKFVTSIMIDIGKSRDEIYDEAKFKDELCEYGSAFIEWRYFFEYGPKININFIKDLLAVLKATTELLSECIDLSSVDVGELSLY